MMKFTTRCRYGLRMMVEIARALQEKELVPLGEIARTTAISKNYLEQLAMPLTKQGILVGKSGKNGGYQLARPVEKIKISEILSALDDPITLSDCVYHPEICLNHSSCETRTLWVMLSGILQDFLENLTLKDLTNKIRFQEWKEKYGFLPLIDSDLVIEEKLKGKLKACARNQFEKNKRTRILEE